MHAHCALRAATPAAAAHGPVLATSVRHFERDGQRAAIPQAVVQVVARFGPTIEGGVDVHALGPRTRVERKFIRGGQRVVLAGLRPGRCEAVLGIPAAELGDAPVPVSALWGDADAMRLRERLAGTGDSREAARRLAGFLAGRPHRAGSPAVPPAFLMRRSENWRRPASGRLPANSASANATCAACCAVHWASAPRPTPGSSGSGPPSGWRSARMPPHGP